MLIPLTDNMCPQLSPEIITKLKDQKVVSVLDFLTCNPSRLRSISRFNAIDFETLLEIKEYLSLRYGPIIVNAFHMFNTIIKNSRQFKTGIEKLDQMLVSGITENDLIQVFGPKNSGKSIFCYTFAVNVAADPDSSVLYIDTNLSFSIDFVRQIVERRLEDLFDSQREGLLSRIRVVRAFDVSSILNIFESIAYDLKTNPNSVFSDLSLVVIDSLTVPLSHESKLNWFEAEEEAKNRNISSKISELRNRTMTSITQIGYTLKNFVRIYSIAAVVVTNESTALKKLWNNYCDTSLKFSINEEIKEINNKTDELYNPYKAIEITKHFRVDPKNKIFNEFIINEKGFLTKEITEDSDSSN